MGLSDAQHAAVDQWLGANAPEDAPLVKALLTAGELSNGDPAAESPKGARGLMQLTPIALRDIGRDPETFAYDSPAESLRAGVDYVRKLRTDYGLTNPLQIAAAYNAGPGTVQAAVEKGGIDHLPEETRNYVRRMAAALSGPAATPPPALDVAPGATHGMPLMTDAADPVDRGPRDKAVDIPDANALMLSDMARQRDALPWYKALPQRALEPLAELGIQGARATTGSDLPPLPPDRLMTDLAQAGGLVASAFPVGRLASAAIQAGAGLAAGLQTAAERHATTGGSWQDQYDAMDATDAKILGTQVILGAGTGYAFGGNRAIKPFSTEGGIANARRDLDTLMARTSAEQLAPAPRTAEVAAAFGRLDRQAVVDATGWRNALLRHGHVDGMTVPREVQAVAERLVPEMRTVTQPGSLAGHTFLPPTMPQQVTQEATGRYFAKVGDLLDANMRLGNMVNTAEARQASAAMGHAAGNLNALRGSLTEQIMDALPAGQRTLYTAARETSRDVAQSNAGMRFLERFLNPDEGILNGKGLYKALTEGGGAASRREILQRRFGAENYRRLVDYGRSVRDITSTPAKVPVLQRLLSLSTQAGVGGAAYAYGGTPGLGAVLGARVLYGVATSRPALRALDAMARADVGSKTFVEATGRLALAQALLAKEIERDAMPAHPVDQLLGAQ